MKSRGGAKLGSLPKIGDSHRPYAVGDTLEVAYVETNFGFHRGSSTSGKYINKVTAPRIPSGQ